MHARRLAAAIATAAVAFPAAAAPTTYTIDPSHTDVLVSWSHFGFSNPTIRFGDVEGTLTYDPQDPTASSVEVTLPLSGLQTQSDEFNEHLESGKWLDAGSYPEATFKSTSVAPAGEGRLEVTGDLTVHGQTRPVTLDVTINEVGEHPMRKVPAAGFAATTTLKRSDFGVGNYAPAVSDEVEVEITVEATADKK
ncbi:polyisoprenoid-binding protein [Coralloluteibacterium stylophorae]|uniref:Polyisoprenoid-binding protein n=1 Tax=Coralloluteibacterium stylophorae TaxID=1776034 RepID=A0A8J7VV26_9GAMM|nr:YceI family protein [Coralloluteibacterium stylophorae]MBS7458494.1 polyisoprenoid-binding protein [Coralloluteibacterium stylophorae]